MQIDIADIADMVKDQISKPHKPWDDYVPIIETDDKITVYLTDGITVPAEYNELCHTLIHATKPVTLVLNTPGGMSYSAFMIVDAMRKCPTPIHGVVTGSVASAGTIITMECDTIEVAPYAEFMIHNYSHSTSGSGAQVKEYVTFTDNEFKKAVADIYSGFLTEEEMYDISERDKEIWLNQKQVLERWTTKKDHLSKPAE